MSDGLKNKHREAILEVLRKHPKIERAVLFGSRAMGTSTPTSDIDIALYGNINMQEQARIAEELRALPIPHTVDLVRMKTVTSPALFEHIKEHGKEWLPGIIMESQIKQHLHDVGILNAEIEWQTLPLEDCMDAIIDYRGKSPNKTTFGVPLITAKIIKNGRIETPNEFIDEDVFDSWMQRGMPQNGDVVMTTEAPLGEVAQLDGSRVALAQRVITLRGRPDLLDNTFLKFLLQSESVQEELKSRATGTTVLGIRQSELRKVALTVPPLSEQKAIARILGTLDDKIELNRRMNATLEAMARALFKSWFIDFDPVRRNAARAQNQPSTRPNGHPSPMPSAPSPCSPSPSGRGIEGEGATSTPPSTFGRGAGGEGAVDEGVGEELDRLFPSTFQDSELGEIPAGWNAAHLEDVIEVFDSKRIPLSNREREQRKGIYPYYGAASVMDYVDDYLFDGIYALMGEDGSVTNSDGTPVLQYVWDKFWVNNHAHVLRGKNSVCTEHLLLYLKNTNIAAFVTGAVQPKLNQRNMNRIPFLLAPSHINEAFATAIEPFFARVRDNTNQTRTLTTIRDTLLPKLLCEKIKEVSNT